MWDWASKLWDGLSTAATWMENNSTATMLLGGMAASAYQSYQMEKDREQEMKILERNERFKERRPSDGSTYNYASFLKESTQPQPGLIASAMYTNRSPGRSY